MQRFREDINLFLLLSFHLFSQESYGMGKTGVFSFTFLLFFLFYVLHTIFWTLGVFASLGEVWVGSVQGSLLLLEGIQGGGNPEWI